MLEKRVKDLDKILSNVQDQRNELKQQLKDERAVLKNQHQKELDIISQEKMATQLKGEKFEKEFVVLKEES